MQKVRTVKPNERVGSWIHKPDGTYEKNLKDPAMAYREGLTLGPVPKTKKINEAGGETTNDKN